MDKYHKASSEAWLHAKEKTGLTATDISRAAGWVFLSGPYAGRITQMEWFIRTGARFPSMESILKIAREYPKFVGYYFESVVFLVEDAPEA